MDSACRIGRTYDDYKNYLSQHNDIFAVEMDSVMVEFKSASLMFKSCDLMLALSGIETLPSLSSTFLIGCILYWKETFAPYFCFIR